MRDLLSKKLKLKESLDEFLALYKTVQDFDVEVAKAMVREFVAYYARKMEFKPKPLKGLTDRWLESLPSGDYDYEVYNDDYYFVDLWACWQVYSRKRLRNVVAYRTAFDLVKESGAIVDLGCGIGYTTTALKQAFPELEVWGTELAGTRHYKFCEFMGNIGGFKVTSDVEAIQRKGVAVFALEYFEHFERPMEHMRQILDKLDPKVMIVANAFHAERPGSFVVFKERGEDIGRGSMPRRFNDALVAEGYKKLRTPFWNDKPTLLVKAAKPPRNVGFGLVA